MPFGWSCMLVSSILSMIHLHFLYKRCNKIDTIRNIQTLLIGSFARTITSMSAFLLNMVHKHVQVYYIFAFDLVSQLILLQLEQIICLINFIKVLYKHKTSSILVSITPLTCIVASTLNPNPFPHVHVWMSLVFSVICFTKGALIQSLGLFIIIEENFMK